MNVFSCRLILARHHLTQAEPSRWLGAAVFQEINPRVWWQTRALSCGRHRLGLSTFGLLILRAKPSWRVPLQKFQFLTEIERGMSHFRPTSRQVHLEEYLVVFLHAPGLSASTNNLLCRNSLCCFCNKQRSSAHT